MALAITDAGATGLFAIPETRDFSRNNTTKEQNIGLVASCFVNTFD